MVVVVGLEYSYVAGHAVSPRRNEAKKILHVKMNMIHNIMKVIFWKGKEKRGSVMPCVVLRTY